ncbi:MAG TPA: hypothetical protein VF173_06255 [Thermoanaerobaculia bacterium]|nr:hypothetical protein [Thermoanaerobaculia bacterium]
MISNGKPEPSRIQRRKLLGRWGERELVGGWCELFASLHVLSAPNTMNPAQRWVILPWIQGLY